MENSAAGREGRSVWLGPLPDPYCPELQPSILPWLWMTLGWVELFGRFTGKRSYQAGVLLDSHLDIPARHWLHIWVPKLYQLVASYSILEPLSQNARYHCLFRAQPAIALKLKTASRSPRMTFTTSPNMGALPLFFIPSASLDILQLFFLSLIERPDGSRIPHCGWFWSSPNVAE